MILKGHVETHFHTLKVIPNALDVLVFPLMIHEMGALKCGSLIANNVFLLTHKYYLCYHLSCDLLFSV